MDFLEEFYQVIQFLVSPPIAAIQYLTEHYAVQIGEFFVQWF